MKPAPQKAKLASSDEKKSSEFKEKTDVDVTTAAVERKGQSEPKAEDTKEATELEKQAGHYSVKKGESLSSIAARKDVYRDPLKWPILFRLNWDKLRKLMPGEDLPDKALPEGMKLEIITPGEVKENAKKSAAKPYVVNVLSSTKKKEIVPLTVTLIKKGYPAYITRGTVKGKEWMRLRVGFFKKKREADALGKEIQKALNLGDSWTTKAKVEEIEEFGGF
ncbi:MAG: SPOR domain-containing protein [Desulfobacteraceae bacterium]|jgi:hypothetical protein